MYVDSHCHINFPEFAERMPEVLQRMQDNGVTQSNGDVIIQLGPEA